jgi:magnesium-transporting ATPase (P-type)
LLGISIKYGRNRFFHTLLQVVFEIPFSSNRKWQLFIVKMEKNQTEASKYKLMMKGAPEILIKKCDKILDSNGDQVMINDKILESFQVICQSAIDVKKI